MAPARRGTLGADEEETLMGDKPPLGKLESVSLRDYWQREDTEFTPWLANEENITLLGDVIGLELEVLDQEARVGPFRADIICQDVRSGAKVLIENQLEATDHGHLGQLLTYASGLDAVYIVWIARSFTEEHRAALDWLNGITGQDFHFFGLEIELWRIGGSALAPKFNLVSKPNEWTKSIKQATSSPLGPGAEMFDLWESFWGALQTWVGENEPTFEIPGGGRASWVKYTMRVPDCHTFMSLVVRGGKVLVGFTLTGDRTEVRYERLQARKGEIEKRFGNSLQWSHNPNQKKAYITWHLKKDISNQETWPEVFRFFCDTVPKFQEVFAEELTAIDGGDGEP
jgi:Domain of unknown function (DUF4268)